jgi:hypothetical protein
MRPVTLLEFFLEKNKKKNNNSKEEASGRNMDIDTGGMKEQKDSPQKKKTKTGKAKMNAHVINEEVAGSFWHRAFDYHKYMEENMPFSNVDVEAGRHGKFAELVQDAGMSALQSLLGFGG